MDVLKSEEFSENSQKSQEFPLSLDDIEEEFNFNPDHPFHLMNTEDIIWARSQRSLLQKYEGEWVAIYQKKVLAHGKDGTQVQEEAFQQLGRKIPELYLFFVEFAHSHILSL